ncbi:hypothetical protein BGZ60DRAFT_433090 [Tricladium varicosporioides]|nr:hypothetical protein BGZ60DRAFT_433090 [Hymenoscyphus varicosporioides]
MIALSIIASALTLCSIISAATFQSRENTEKYYSLKRKAPIGDKTKDVPYVSIHHIGAGTSDAALTTKPPVDLSGLYNKINKTQQFKAFFDDMNLEKQLWDFELGYQSYYTFWPSQCSWPGGVESFNNIHNINNINLALVLYNAAAAVD